MKKTFLDFYNNFAENASKLNDQIVTAYKNKKIIFASKEIYSLYMSENILKDIKTILQFKNNHLENRYIDFIIRNMCEQVIEYLYILEHEELIKIYFGEYLDFKEQQNPFDTLKQAGQARFKTKISVRKMAKEIEELNNTNEKIALYEIFSLKSEYIHNSYFYQIFDIVGEIESFNEQQNHVEHDIDYIFMIFILAAFVKQYNKISFN